MISLSWQQVNAWRLAQHCLSERLQRRDLLLAVKRTGGIQVQVMSAAEIALGIRVDGLSPRDVQSALWQDRTLIKTWAMRAALHLIPASDLPIYVAARSLSETLNWPHYFNYYGISQTVLEDYLCIAPEILGNQPMRREEFAIAVSERLRSTEIYDLLVTKGWGTPLKPLAWRGDLCFGPNQGQNVTFVNPHKWLNEWQSVEPYSALQEMVRRYLNAFGPATPKDFAMWWGNRITPTRTLFKSLEEELEPVEVEGWQAIALRTTLEPMQNLKASETVNLLPLFDAYTLGLGRGLEIEPILSMNFQKLVYRPQGWISAVVLVDGFIKGVWEYTSQRTQTRIIVYMFSSPTTEVKAGIAFEAERLSKFLNKNIMLEFKLS